LSAGDNQRNTTTDRPHGEDNLAIYHCTAVGRSHELNFAQWMTVKIGCCNVHLRFPFPAELYQHWPAYIFACYGSSSTIAAALNRVKHKRSAQARFGENHFGASTQADRVGNALAVLILVAHDPIKVHARGRQVAVVQGLLHLGKRVSILANERREGVACLMDMGIPEPSVLRRALEVLGKAV
jgi:hypothetical protein